MGLSVSLHLFERYCAVALGACRYLFIWYNVVTIVTYKQEAVMRMFEIHELEDRITEVLHQVQETGETVSVTEGGEVIAHLVPARTAQWLAQMPDDTVWTDLDSARAEKGAPGSKDVNALDNPQDVWASLDRLSAEISALWPKDVSAVDAIRDVRREL